MKRRAAEYNHMELAIIRITVSADTYDIPIAEFRDHPHCIIPDIAAYAEARAGVAEVRFTRDPKAFRIIRHCLATGSLLVPVDPIEREILRSEWSFYGMNLMESQLAKPESLQFYGTPATPQQLMVEDTPRVVPTEPGYVAPSAEVLKAFTAAATNEGHQYWRQGLGGDAPRVDCLSAEDAGLIALEIDARAVFGQDEDGSEFVPTLEFAEGPLEYSSYGPTPAEYTLLTVGEQVAPVVPQFLRRQRLRNPGIRAMLAHMGAAVIEHARDSDDDRVSEHSERSGYESDEYEMSGREDRVDNVPVLESAEDGFKRESLGLASTVAEVLENLEAITLMDLVELTAGLPLVVAGGIMTAALHLWPVANRNWVEATYSSETLKRLNSATLNRKYARLIVPHYRRGLPVPVKHHYFEEKEFYEKLGRRAAARPANGFTPLEYRGYCGSDIDLFLVTQSADEALATIAELYRRYKEYTGGDVSVVRTGGSVSFITEHWRPLQIILQLYHSATQVILGFDVDCCAVCLDAGKIIALPRAARALHSRYNLVDVTRQSTTYESRLFKYAKRGFSVAIPYPVDMAKQVARVAEQLRVYVGTRTYATFRGMDLLIAMFETWHTRNKKAAATLNLSMNDYSGLSAVPGTCYRLRANIKSCNAMKERLFYVAREDLAALATNQTNIGGITHNSSVSPVISFRVAQPHLQDRVDLLWSGSFNPVASAWITN